jgi:REP element-mobilizing transposase RayT
LEGSTYFITFRLMTGTLTQADRRVVRDHISAGHRRFYSLVAVVVMPDHVHLILRPLPGLDLSRIMKGIKGVSANLLNRARGTAGTVWQDESYDRIIRNEDEFNEKLNYMLNNPAKAGLCAPGEEYDGWSYHADPD